MTSSRTIATTALALALGFAASAALAQAAGAKSLGGNAAKGATMSKAELRACLKEQQDQQARAAALEKRRVEVAAEAEAVRKQKDAVQAERDGLVARTQAFNDRVKAHGERVVLYNQRLKEFQDNPPRGPDAERERGQLEAEGEAVAKADAAIKAEGAQWSSTIEAARAALAERVRAQQAAAAEAIEHHRAFNDEVKAYDDALAAWQERCGNRPYREADEKAVRAELAAGR